MGTAFAHRDERLLPVGSNGYRIALFFEDITQILALCPVILYHEYGNR
jgi:hypothetical protein